MGRRAWLGVGILGGLCMWGAVQAGGGGAPGAAGAGTYPLRFVLYSTAYGQDDYAFRPWANPNTTVQAFVATNETWDKPGTYLTQATVRNGRVNLLLPLSLNAALLVPVTQYHSFERETGEDCQVQTYQVSDPQARVAELRLRGLSRVNGKVGTFTLEFWGGVTDQSSSSLGAAQGRDWGRLLYADRPTALTLKQRCHSTTPGDEYDTTSSSADDVEVTLERGWNTVMYNAFSYTSRDAQSDELTMRSAPLEGHWAPSAE